MKAEQIARKEDPGKENKRRLGSQYEELACAHLQEEGYLILERNYHAGRMGEIDLIAQKEGVLVFVEVKYRKDAKGGYPAEAVTQKKQRTISRVADQYLKMHRYPVTTACRFDVIAILGEELEHYENAFFYQGRR